MATNTVVAVLGDRTTCAISRAFAAKGGAAELQRQLPGVLVIDADRVESAAAYKTYRPKEAFTFVTFRVLRGGKYVGQYRAASTTKMETIVKNILKICPDCEDLATAFTATTPAAAAPTVSAGTSCPNCGKRLTVTFSAILLGLFFVGCVNTNVRYTKDAVTGTFDASMKRTALFYNTETDIDITGFGKMKGYKGNAQTDALIKMLQLGAAIGGHLPLGGLGSEELVTVPVPVPAQTTTPASGDVAIP